MGRSSSPSTSDESEKKKHTKHKKGHKHKKEKKEKQKKEKHKKENKATRERGDGGPPAGVQPLTSDDYFRRTHEYQRWLQESRGLFLEDIPSAEARALFEKFVERWNCGKLSAKTYDVGAGGGGVQRTKHRWGFTSKMSADEIMQLESARDTIVAQTQRAAGQGRDAAAIARADQANAAGRGAPSASLKRRHQDSSAILDATAGALGLDTSRPDAGSREAMLEKRRAQTAYHRGKEEDDGPPEMGEAVLLGADAGEWSRGVARRQEATSRKSQQVSARVQELEAKEDARMEGFKRQMGLL